MPISTIGGFGKTDTKFLNIAAGKNFTGHPAGNLWILQYKFMLTFITHISNCVIFSFLISDSSFKACFAARGSPFWIRIGNRYIFKSCYNLKIIL